MKKISVHSFVGVVVLFLIISYNYSRALFQENTEDWNAFGDTIGAFLMKS